MSNNNLSSQNSPPSESIRSPHLDREWLWQKYIVEGLSTYQIAELVGRNPKNIYCKLKDFGIPTRTRADAIRQNSWWLHGHKPSMLGRKHTAATRKLQSELVAGKKRPHLCGANNWMYGRKGEQSPNWKGGTTPERQKLYGTPEWKALVKYIYARDLYTCQRCGVGHNRSNKLHAHHIKSWAEYPDLRSTPENLITLCNGCHEWVHSNGNTERQFIG